MQLRVNHWMYYLISTSTQQDPFGDILRVHWLLPIWAPNGKVSVLGENCPFGHPM